MSVLSFWVIDRRTGGLRALLMLAPWPAVRAPFAEGGPEDPGGPAPGDSVDGTFSVAVSLQYATGILVPPSQGSFTVTLPTVTISAIAP